MNGLDQVVVALWLLPVVLFILVPLCMTVLWGIASFFFSFKTSSAGEKKQASVDDAVTA